jgi:dTDP-3-amino-3,4,6-trideoxy-alpha-D-glucose transaminase
VDSNRFVLGPEVDAFESEFADYVGTRHCVGVGSGLDALRFSLTSVGVEAGHEVIVPAHTFAATWFAVSHIGANPVPVDVHPESGNLDPALLEENITPRTKAIVAVDMHGLPAEYRAIEAIATQYEIPVVEDAAQAHGASYHGRRSGALAPVAAFSFYPGKNLGALGDAGCVTTDDEQVAASVRKLRNYGGLVKYQHDLAGFNSRLDEVQAAVLRVKLRHLDNWNARRREIADSYLSNLRGLRLLSPPPRAVNPVWHLFPVRSRARDTLREGLASLGIATGVHYPQPVGRLKPDAAATLGHVDTPVADEFAARSLSLPIGPHMNDEQVQLVVRETNRLAAQLPS